MSFSPVTIVCKSPHHGNTLKVADAMAGVLGAQVLTPEEADAEALAGCELLGLGSGIYFGRHHQTIRELADRAALLPPRVFIFSTAGTPWMHALFHRSLRRKLARRGCEILGEFTCRGWDTVGPLALFGGLNRRHPDELDLAAAADFARGVKARANTPANDGPAVDVGQT